MYYYYTKYKNTEKKNSHQAKIRSINDSITIAFHEQRKNIYASFYQKYIRNKCVLLRNKCPLKTFSKKKLNS